MNNNDYLYAVAVIRANEAMLLNNADLEQLINAPDYRKAVALLADKGWEAPEGGNYSQMLDKELDKAWALVRESAPEAEALQTFIVKNDFQNLKAILKAGVTGHDAKDFFVSPCVIPPEEMLEAVSERKFADLPEFISATAEKAFKALTKTGNGQLCDVIIDTDALETIIAFAKESGDKTLIDYAESFCLAADIKTAYRSIKTGKEKAFLDTAVAKCDGVDKQGLIEAALKGEEEFFAFLQTCGLTGYKEALENGTSAFEKYCDDKALEMMKKAKMTAFGISPLAAFFVARETEVKCLRIILSAKISGSSNDVIRERMRELYV